MKRTLPFINLKTVFSIIFLFYYSIGLIAQEREDTLSREKQWDICNQANKQADSLSSIEPINKLLNSKTITIKELEVELLASKIGYIAIFNGLFQEEKITDRSLLIKKTNTIINIYDSLIRVIDCEWVTIIKSAKHNTLKNIVRVHGKEIGDSIYTLYESGKPKDKTRWLFPQKDGVGLGITYHKGNENWIGLGFSMLNFYSPVKTFSDTCKGDIYKYKPYNHSLTFSMSLFTLSFNKSLNTNSNEVSFSLFDLNSPISLSPANFGAQFDSNSSKPLYYYRPSIGIGIGPISIGYSYNLMFSKKERFKAEKNLFTIKFNYPIISFKYRKKSS